MDIKDGLGVMLTYMKNTVTHRTKLDFKINARLKNVYDCTSQISAVKIPVLRNCI